MTDEKFETSLKIEQLHSQNYYMWSNEMEILLRGKGLWEFVEGTAVEPVDENGKKMHQRKKT